MPGSQIRIAAISNRNELRSQSASEIAARITSRPVVKERAEIGTEITVIRSSAISNRQRVGFEIADDVASKVVKGGSAKKMWLTPTSPEDYLGLGVLVFPNFRQVTGIRSSVLA